MFFLDNHSAAPIQANTKTNTVISWVKIGLLKTRVSSLVSEYSCKHKMGRTITRKPACINNVCFDNFQQFSRYFGFDTLF